MGTKLSQAGFAGRLTESLLPFLTGRLPERKPRLIGGVAVAFALLISARSAEANLITNGSFENGAFVDNTSQNTMDLAPGSTAMTGWTVTSANLAWIGPTNPFGLSASDGSYFLDLSGYHDNKPYGGVAASTARATVIGQQYDVSFALGSDRNYDTQSPSIQVDVSGNPANGTFTAGTIADAVDRWQTFNFLFVATSASTTIEFDGVGADNQKYVGLDNVSVTAVPEVSTAISGLLLLLPFGVGMLRILRTRAVK
jgi:Protein of unknown function (DUF642)